MRAVLWCFLLISCPVIAGAWGYGSFENDGASDWADELDQSKGDSHLAGAFNGITGSGYIDVDNCSIAIAAADVLASIRDGKTDHLPKGVAAWVRINKHAYSSNLAETAKKALSYCRDSTRSELAQLWSEGSPKEWLASVAWIEIRLK